MFLDILFSSSEASSGNATASVNTVAGLLLLLGVAIFTIIAIALYIYFAFAWMEIAKKRKHKYPWLAWIPFANLAMWLQLGKFHWAWIFLLVIPILGWIAVGVLLIIAHWRVFEALKYPRWLSLILILQIIPIISWIATVGYGVIIGLVAWKKN